MQKAISEQNQAIAFEQCACSKEKESDNFEDFCVYIEVIRDAIAGLLAQLFANRNMIDKNEAAYYEVIGSWLSEQALRVKTKEDYQSVHKQFEFFQEQVNALLKG